MDCGATIFESDSALPYFLENPTKTQQTAKTAKPKVSTDAAAKAGKVHVVQSGDSLWTISKKYPGISVENLKEWNGISGNNLKPGTKLKLCECSS